jgi:hypothetical protein
LTDAKLFVTATTRIAVESKRCNSCTISNPTSFKASSLNCTFATHRSVKMSLATNKVVGLFISLCVVFWDAGYFILNLITPSLKPGHAVTAYAVGHGGTWPPYVPPKEGDSRSACPMLNAMANHVRGPLYLMAYPPDGC